ncbi:ABA responsive element binding factor protein [Dioscorea alata]|uniref:ABA responsive element binding factor protein n=5 Tax=Dioscorea alata TaxID=55571 RepID=A0ACB7U0X4_DIOAL|nr:ABA responsive element binding factor protein [Dioscorea alata]KAH7653975.1 ABA responsive element binding factor protein [Dioscorea alata]KAH7653976.1 ABA responsive element binding factor protein [Dioscorea alata]KAH7653977.1 ABA responsive element binding factor protein [Dioscorea alata]KAH7653978.1 ABA responsive element binding factor protein [Dioscorea alata]
MGIQTMASDGGGGSGAQQSQIQNMVRQGSQQSQIQNLARQGSLYNLTLNEVQSHLGEPLSSMNLDELLKSVFPGEINPVLPMEIEGTGGNYASGSGLQSQGSITMSRALSKKTVDEVWKEIQDGRSKNNEEHGVAGQERQPTFGEITLEDFLEKAGIIAEGSTKKRNDPVGNVDPMSGAHDFTQGAHWLLQYQQMPAVPQPQTHQNLMGAYAMYADAQMNLASPTIGALSDSQTPGRKRGAQDELTDKIVERRQKRMIKNRESAARSRARKQAYTNELENKVSRLEEENERLKKQKELNKLLSVPPPEPRYQLRRTSSASF